MSAHDNEVQAARERLELELKSATRRVRSSSMTVFSDDLCTLLSALATAERERDEALSVIDGVKLAAYPAHGSGFVAIITAGGAQLQALQALQARRSDLGLSCPVVPERASGVESDPNWRHNAPACDFPEAVVRAQDQADAR